MNIVQQKIDALENILAALPQTDIPVQHTNAGGMAARTILLEKGTILTGAIHLSAHLNVVHGDITIVGENGARRYTGAHVIASEPGTKRVGFVHAPTTWTTIVKTDETDPETIKAQMTAARFDDPRLAADQPLEMIGE